MFNRKKSCQKLTAVTVLFRGNRYTRFVMAEHTEGKGAFVPNSVIDSILDEIGVQRGQTYSIG